jgi:hypothetical protein
MWPVNSEHAVVHDVLRTFDEVHARILARLEGLSDSEYLWEPVCDCWTIRADHDGLFRADGVPEVDPLPAPVTTIAWRMWHIGADCLRGYCEHFFGDERPEQDPSLWPGTADAGIRALDADWSRFRSNVEALGDEGLLGAMGPRAGRYAEDSYLALVLHALDEAAHHGAELGLLRDLHLRGFKI